MPDVKGVSETPALGVSINAQVDGKRQIVFQTHVASDAPQAEIDALLDKLNASIDRSVAFYEIGLLEDALERDKQILYSIKHNMDNIEENMRVKYEASGKRGEFKLSSQEKMQKTQAHDNLTRQTEIVKLAESRLAEARKKAGVRDGASSPANS